MKLSQTEKVLDYISENGSITSLEAIKEFGCMRLASRISDLKKQGYDIRSEMIVRKNRYGENVRFAKYTMESANENHNYRAAKN